MLWSVAIILGLLWALGMASSYSAAGYIHLLIVAAMIMVVYGIHLHRRDRRAS